MTPEGSSEGFDRFVADAGPALLRTAYLMLWDLPAAEDLVQESLLEVARRWPRVARMEHPLAYARRILVNRLLSGTKRRARHRSELDRRPVTAEIRDETAARELGFAEYRHELQRAVGALPPRQRATLVLRYFEDLTEAQTAAVLGCSVGTVKSTTSRALERLRAQLGPTVHPGRAPSGDTDGTAEVTLTEGARER